MPGRGGSRLSRFSRELAYAHVVCFHRCTTIACLKNTANVIAYMSTFKIIKLN